MKFFKSLIGEEFTIFDKKVVLMQSNDISHDDTPIKEFNSYIENLIIQRELTAVLKNKKIKNIIYLLHDTDPNLVISNITTYIKPNINKLIEFVFHTEDKNLLVEKSVQWWLSKHPDNSIRDSSIKYLLDTNSQIAKIQCDSYSEALYESFNFSKTIEGQEFWMKVAEEGDRIVIYN